MSRLLNYTPRVAVLLTEVDVLSAAEQREVLDFVRTQLARNFTRKIPVFPYSTRDGYQELRFEMERNLIARVSEDVTHQRQEIASQKAALLLRECEDYIA